MSKITCATVNKFLRSKGIGEVLVKGKDYMYFSEGDSSNWFSTSVYVISANDLSLEQWLLEYKHLSGYIN